MSVVIMDARLCHLRELARTLRADDLREVMASGLKPRHLLYRLWTGSFIRKVALMDGEVAAIWGCEGTILSPRGDAWLLTSAAVERKPITFLKVLKQSLAEMLEIKQEIGSHVLSSYHKSIRLMQMAGFEIGSEIKVGDDTFLELRLGR